MLKLCPQLEYLSLATKHDLDSVFTNEIEQNSSLSTLYLDIPQLQLHHIQIINNALINLSTLDITQIDTFCDWAAINALFNAQYDVTVSVSLSIDKMKKETFAQFWNVMDSYRNGYMKKLRIVKDTNSEYIKLSNKGFTTSYIYTIHISNLDIFHLFEQNGQMIDHLYVGSSEDNFSMKIMVKAFPHLTELDVSISLLT